MIFYPEFGTYVAICCGAREMELSSIHISLAYREGRQSSGVHLAFAVLTLYKV
jgi:hypothetical protein